MTVYKLINPSDETTLEASSLAVAAFCAITLSPRYGVKEDGEEDQSFFEPFHAVDEFIKQFGDPDTFMREHLSELAQCWESFAYLSREERIHYKRALELIDDPAKRATFRDEHEDRRRSSMNDICKAAWQLAKECRDKLKAEQKRTRRNDPA